MSHPAFSGRAAVGLWLAGCAWQQPVEEVPRLPPAASARTYTEPFRRLRISSHGAPSTVDATGPGTRWLVEIDRDRQWSAVCPTLLPLWQSDPHASEFEPFGFVAAVEASNERRWSCAGVWPRGITLNWSPAFWGGDPPEDPQLLGVAEGGLRFQGGPSGDAPFVVTAMREAVRDGSWIELDLAPDDPWATVVYLADLAWQAGAAQVRLPPCNGWIHEDPVQDPGGRGE